MLCVITATLASPMVIEDDLHLDGLLQSAHPMCRSSPISRQVPVSQIPQPPLPVMAHSLDRARAFLCTTAQFPDEARMHASPVVKRRDAEDVESLARPIHLGLGPGKNRMHRLQTIVTPWVQWRAIGRRREILRLVRRIQQVGTWRSAGYGIVTSWHVEYDQEADPVTVLIAGGVAQRHLPACWCDAAQDITIGAHESPYWHPGRQREQIVRAGTRCSLHRTVEEAIRAVATPDALRAHRARKDARRLARRAGAYPPDVLARGSGAAGHP